MTNNDVSRVSLCERSRTDSRKNVGPWNLLPYCFAAVLGHSQLCFIICGSRLEWCGRTQ